MHAKNRGGDEEPVRSSTESRLESKEIGERQEEQEEDAGVDVGCDRRSRIRSRISSIITVDPFEIGELRSILRTIGESPGPLGFLHPNRPALRGVRLSTLTLDTCPRRYIVLCQRPATRDAMIVSSLKDKETRGREAQRGKRVGWVYG